jgi:hypothetical protein
MQSAAVAQAAGQVPSTAQRRGEQALVQQTVAFVAPPSLVPLPIAQCVLWQSVPVVQGWPLAAPGTPPSGVGPA